MGVFGTYCQVCGVAVQHDHYVPLRGELLGIYRGGPEGSEFTPVVAFGPEHAWLERVVGLALTPGQEPAVVRGRCSDGVLEAEAGTVFLGDGIDERAALHEACWRLAGEPTSWEALAPAVRPHDLAPYQEQLFEFGALVDDGLGWTLVDPGSDTPDGRRNRARILALLWGGDRRLPAAPFRPPPGDTLPP